MPLPSARPRLCQQGGAGLRLQVMVAVRKAPFLPKGGRNSMESQHIQLPQDEPEQYEAPAGKDLGKFEELTAADVCFPSCQYRG